MLELLVLLPPSEVRSALAIRRRIYPSRQAPECNSEDSTVDNSSHVESPAPSYGVCQDTTQRQTYSEADRLSATHGSKGKVSPLAHEGPSDNRDSARQAERQSNAAETTEEDDLRGGSAETAAEDEACLEDTAEQVHEP